MIKLNVAGKRQKDKTDRHKHTLYAAPPEAHHVTPALDEGE